jgi:HSP20 family protein
MTRVSSSFHFSQRLQPATARDQEPHWVPNTDVYESDDGLVIKVELAGMRREDLELTAEGNCLRISGQRPDGCRPLQCRFLVMEINFGAFESVIELPPGFDLPKAKASYQNGFLRIDVPVSAPSAPHTLSLPVNETSDPS